MNDTTKTLVENIRDHLDRSRDIACCVNQLRDIFNLDDTKLAAYYKERGDKNSDIARALISGVSKDDPEYFDKLKSVAQALYSKSGAGLAAEEVALALCDETGLDLTPEETARVMRDALKMSAKDVAEVLYSEDGLDLEVGDIAYTLYAEDGLNLSPGEAIDITAEVTQRNHDEVAIAFGIVGNDVALEGLAENSDCEYVYQTARQMYTYRTTAVDIVAKYYPINELFEALVNEGSKEVEAIAILEDRGLIETWDDVVALDSLSNEGLAKAANVIISGERVVPWIGGNESLYMRLLPDEELDVFDVAHALTDRGCTPEMVASLLYSENGLDLDAVEVAEVLYSEDGLNLDAESVAQALHSLGLSKTEVAAALSAEDGLNLDSEEIASALKAIEPPVRGGSKEVGLEF